jgi:acyl-CoA reductase-like NAD-dependent aldehyde dehydrogenase
MSSVKFDKIIFTGSTEKGKLVAMSAAKNLTPCLLELGGKSPAIVDKSANLKFTAEKLAFLSFFNSG